MQEPEPRRSPPSQGEKPKHPLEAAREAVPSPSGAPGLSMSRRELAEAANAYLWHTHQRRENLDEHDIGNYERGSVRWPRYWRRVALCRVLGIADPTQLGLYPNRRRAASPAPRTGGTEPSASAMSGTVKEGTTASPQLPEDHATGSRAGRFYPDGASGPSALVRASVPSVLGASNGMLDIGAGGPGLPWPNHGHSAPSDHMDVRAVVGMTAQESWRHAAEAGGGVDAVAVEQVQAQVRRLARHYHELPPIRLLGELRQTRDMAYLLLTRTRRPAQTADLYLAAGQACGLMAMGSFDLALWDAAADQVRAASTYSDLVGHRDLSSWAAGTLALIAYWTDRPQQAVSVLDAAASRTRAGHQAARLQAIQARAWAHLGDADQVAAALRSADAYMEDGDDGGEAEDMAGEFGWGRSLHLACAGTALLAIGNADDATRRIRAALATAPHDPHAGMVPERARVDLAAAELTANRFDAAADALDRVWQIPVRYRRHGLTARMTQVSRALAKPAWRRHRPAAQLRDRIEGFVDEALAGRALPAA